MSSASFAWGTLTLSFDAFLVLRLILWRFLFRDLINEPSSVLLISVSRCYSVDQCLWLPVQSLFASTVSVSIISFRCPHPFTVHRFLILYSSFCAPYFFSLNNHPCPSAPVPPPSPRTLLFDPSTPADPSIEASPTKQLPTPMCICISFSATANGSSVSLGFVLESPTVPHFFDPERAYACVHAVTTYYYVLLLILPGYYAQWRSIMVRCARLLLRRRPPLVSVLFPSLLSFLSLRSVVRFPPVVANLFRARYALIACINIGCLFGRDINGSWSFVQITRLAAVVLKLFEVKDTLNFWINIDYSFYEIFMSFETFFI